MPEQAWKLLFAVGVGAAVYIWRYFAGTAATDDDTQLADSPSPWAKAYLYLSIAALVALAAVGIFHSTPAVKGLLHPESFREGIAVFGGLALLGIALHGLWHGRTKVMLRGLDLTFHVSEQPIRYWLSILFNAGLGLIVLGSLSQIGGTGASSCDASASESKLAAALEDCTQLLQDEDLGLRARARLLAARGEIYDRLDMDSRALADYSAALRIEPENADILYYRGLIYEQMDDFSSALDDFNASLAVQPDQADVYNDRGLLFLRFGALKQALDDFTALHKRYPDHPYALVNRGLAYAWMNKADLAEKDFAGLKEGDDAWTVVLAGRAVLAKNNGDLATAIDYLTQRLNRDSEDYFALRMRADLYWELGKWDLARADDDVSLKIDDRNRPAFGTTW